MPVRVTCPPTAWVILTVGTTGCPIAAVGVPAVIAAAAAERIAGQGAVPVAVPSRVRLSTAQGCVGVGREARHPQPRRFLHWCLEQQILAVQVTLHGVRLQLGGDLGAELKTP